MGNLLHAIVAPSTCLNTTEARRTIDFLSVVDAAKSPWWSTWVQFQVQYYSMPRKPGDRIESPATLGRKCWAFAYLRQIWGADAAGGGLRTDLEARTAAHGLDVRAFVAVRKLTGLRVGALARLHVGGQCRVERGGFGTGVGQRGCADDAAVRPDDGQLLCERELLPGPQRHLP